MDSESLIIALSANILQVRLFAPESKMVRRIKASASALPQLDRISQGLIDVNVSGGYKPPETIEELTPAEEDYIYPVFRAISKSFVEDYSLDFTYGDVLKESTPLLNGATVYPDHRKIVEGWLGVVQEAVWDEEMDPPGINTTWKIDWKMNPKIARGMLMEPPALHSSSVTANVEWIQSHEMDRRQFWESLGTEVDGSIVRFIITRIVEYLEHSLVWAPADRNARRKRIQKEVKALSGSSYSISLGQSFHLHPGDLVIPPQQSNQNSSEEPVLTKEVLALLGIEDASPSIDRVQQAILSLKEESTSLASKIVEKETEITKLQTLSVIGEEYLKDLRGDVLRLATSVEAPDGKLDPAIAEMISTANLSLAKSLKKQYEEKANKLFPFTCQSCKSNDVARRSSIEVAPQQSKPASKTNPLAYV